ncbi:MAG: ArsR/SmtB family transcription factor [Blautia obeum]
MSSPAVSHHLRQLKTRRLIVSHRSGKEVYYKPADTPQVHTLHSCLERLISLSDSTEHQTEVSNDTETR